MYFHLFVVYFCLEPRVYRKPPFYFTYEVEVKFVYTLLSTNPTLWKYTKLNLLFVVSFNYHGHLIYLWVKGTLCITWNLRVVAALLICGYNNVRQHFLRGCYSGNQIQVCTLNDCLCAMYQSVQLLSLCERGCQSIYIHYIHDIYK